MCVRLYLFVCECGAEAREKEVCVYLLNVLLEHTQLQALVQPDLAVLPDVLQLPLVVQHLVDHVQHVVHRLGVVSRGRQRIGTAGGEGSL